MYVNLQKSMWNVISIFKKIFYLFLAVLDFCCCSGFCLVAANESFSLWWLLLLQSTASRHTCFSSCDSWALEHRINSCGQDAYVAPRHVGSSWIRDPTRVSCLSRQILSHWATREAPQNYNFWNALNLCLSVLFLLYYWVVVYRIGEVNDNPLQYSCLENPMDRGAWRAPVQGVATVGHDSATNLPPPVYCISQFAYPPSYGWMTRLFWFSTLMNKTALNVLVHIFLGKRIHFS